VTRDVLLQNNFFDPSGNTYAIQMDDYANVDLRYNSIAGPILIFDRQGPAPGSTMDEGGLRKKKGCLGLVLLSSAMCSLWILLVSVGTMRGCCCDTYA
jgi:hypothetical protein